MKIRTTVLAFLALGLTHTVTAQPHPTQTADSLRARITSLRHELDSLERLGAARYGIAPKIDSARLQPVASVRMVQGVLPLDTLTTIDEAVNIVIFNDNSWKYCRNRDFVRDSTIYTRYWSTSKLFPYSDVALDSLPRSIAIDLVDSLSGYHHPYQAKVRSRYGIRRGRRHQGVDLSLKMGDPIYATFNGKVRISEYNRGGYGNLVIIRHDNGLETFYGHLSERLVQPDEWVEAGQVIGYGGSTGRSTGPHLHFETRYFGRAFDPERLIDFENGLLLRQTFLLKRSFFDIRSNAAQDFEGEEAAENEEKREAAERAAITYHTIRSGDTLGAIARRYGTTVSKICSLNGIKSTTVLRIGRKLRVR